MLTARLWRDVLVRCIRLLLVFSTGTAAMRLMDLLVVDDGRTTSMLEMGKEISRSPRKTLEVPYSLSAILTILKYSTS